MFRWVWAEVSRPLLRRGEIWGKKIEILENLYRNRRVLEHSGGKKAFTPTSPYLLMLGVSYCVRDPHVVTYRSSLRAAASITPHKWLPCHIWLSSHWISVRRLISIVRHATLVEKCAALDITNDRMTSTAARWYLQQACRNAPATVPRRDQTYLHCINSQQAQCKGQP